MRRVLLVVLTTMILLLALLAGAVVWVAGTESGTRWLTHQALAFLPDTVSIGQVSGTLSSPLRLNEVKVNAGGARIDVQRAGLDWQPGALLRGDLRVLRLAAEEVTVALPPPSVDEPPPARSPKPLTLPSLQLPLDVQLLEVSIRNLRIIKGDAANTPVYDAESVQLAATLDDAGLTLKSLRVASPLVDLQAQAHLSADPDRRAQLDATMQWRVPNQPALDARASLRGPMSDLALQLDITAPSRVNITGHVRGLTVAAIPDWTLQAQLDDTALQTVNPQWPPMTVGARIDATGSGAQQAQVTATVAAQHQTLNIVATADSAWNGSTATVSKLTVALPQHGSTATAWGTITPQPQQPLMDLTVAWNHVYWPLENPATVTSPHGKLTLHGTPASYQFQLNAEVDTAQVPRAALTAQGAGSTTQLQVSRLTAQTGPTQAALSGTMSWRDGVQFAAAGEWHSLRWPLADGAAPAAVSSHTGHIHGAGTPDAFALAVDGDVAAPGAPPLQLELGAIGHTDRIDIARLHSELLGGTMNATGQVAWQNGLRWQAQIAGKDLDLARWRDLPASDLTLRLRSEGAVNPQGALETVAQLEQLSGHVAQQKVKASARVSVAQDTIKIDPLRLRIGASTAYVQGSVGEKVNLHWNVHGRELHVLDKRLAGNFDAEGQVTGLRAAPHVNLTLAGSQLRALNARLDRVDLDATATLAIANLDRARLTLHASGLAYGEQRIDQLLLRAQGDGTNQHAVLALAGAEHGATFVLKGAAAGKAWEGALESGIVAWAPNLTWRPTEPTQLRIETGRFHFGKACWKSEQGSVCALGEHASQGPWRIAVRAPDLGLNLFQRWVPAQIALTGTVDAGLSAEGGPGQIRLADAKLEFAEATVRSDDPFSPPTAINFSGAHVRANLDEQTLNVTAGLKMTPGGTLQAHAQVPAPALFADPMSAPIDAHLDVKLSQLDALSTLVPKISEVGGRIGLTAALAGTLQNPQLQGRLELADASLDVPDSGLEVRDIKFSAQAESVRNIVLAGSARSGGGSVTLSGNAGLRKGGFRLEARLDGDNFTAVDTRELRALISPDITLVTSADGTTVTGAVRIPEATIRIKKPKGAVQTSNDVVVLDEQTGSPATPRRVAMQIRVDLGDRVNMDAFNLRAHLGGGAQITMEPAKPATAVGSFSIEEGFYEAWGVALRIERGHVVYVDNPVNNPGLDIRATRKTGEVIAGLNVRGTLADPKVEVFSEPAMNESDAFSYLLFGRPLTRSTNAESGEGYDAVNAARSMGLEIAAKQLVQKLGLEDVQVQTDEEGNSTVVMGRYLSPKIYVGYGVGVVDQITSFHLDYLLSRRWTIRTQTSAAATAADLLFSLDSD